MMCRIAARTGSPEIRPSLIEIWQPLAWSEGGKQEYDSGLEESDRQG